MNSIIEVKKVSKVYKLYKNKKDRLREALSMKRKKFHRDFYALEDINLDVKKGEVLGIIGRNGAGKSTLLKVITGVLTPTTGTVKINGKISALIELGAGFNPEYTGMENIFFYGILMGFSREEMENKVEEIINFADIGDFINQPVKNYSSGMFARLAFSVAINVEPDILIVDEALSVGDIFFQEKCYKKFAEFKNNGKTILFVTHDVNTIIKYCDSAIIIKEGKILQKGAPTEITNLFKKVTIENKIEQYDNNLKIKENFKERQKWSDRMELNTNSDIYGSNELEIKDFGIFNSNNEVTNTLYLNEEFELKIKIKFLKETTNPIIAFGIRDVKGNEILGTNSELEGEVLGKVKNGEEIIISFKQKNILKAGSYIFSFACTGYENNRFTVYDRHNSIFHIEVIASKGIVGFVDMDSKIKIERRKSVC